MLKRLLPARRRCPPSFAPLGDICPPDALAGCAWWRLAAIELVVPPMCLRFSSGSTLEGGCRCYWPPKPGDLPGARRFPHPGRGGPRGGA